MFYITQIKITKNKFKSKLFSEKKTKTLFFSKLFSKTFPNFSKNSNPEYFHKISPIFRIKSQINRITFKRKLSSQNSSSNNFQITFLHWITQLHPSTIKSWPIDLKNTQTNNKKTQKKKNGRRRSSSTCCW